SSFAASASSIGIRPGSISMIVTSEPKRRKIEANSQPMIPPPRTTSRRGTSVCARRPVESTQRGESSPPIGGRIGNEPVATIADLNATSSAPSTASVLASLNRPFPRTHSTPFALKSEATPCVICLTTFAFHSFDAAKSSSGSPTRSFANVSSASFSANAVCTHAFVGMQPTRRHVPPSASSCSTQTAFAPSCAARIAAVYPPGPPPRTATSQSIRSPCVRSLSGSDRSFPARSRTGCNRQLTDTSAHRHDSERSPAASPRELRAHHPGAAALADLREALALVEVERRVVGLDAQADGGEPVLAGLREQRLEQLAAEAATPAARHDGDGQLGRLLVDEPVARRLHLEQPVPGGADGLEAVDRDQHPIAWPAP